MLSVTAEYKSIPCSSLLTPPSLHTLPAMRSLSIRESVGEQHTVTTGPCERCIPVTFSSLEWLLCFLLHSLLLADGLGKVGQGGREEPFLSTQPLGGGLRYPRGHSASCNTLPPGSFSISE